MKGFYGKLLRVDLSRRSWVAEAIPDEVFQRYLGGKGLGSHLLLENVKPGTDALSPENKVIFTTGAATDTLMVGSSRYGVYSKSPLTGFYAESTSGGRVAFPMRRTGYDAMVIEGASETSVFLEISENRLTIFSTQILCVFFRDLIPWEDLVDLNRALTGLDYTKEDLWEVANRVIDLTRKFNLQEGLTREDDSLPPRLFKEKINEGNDGITRDELNCMVDDYYRIRGWQ